jgi:hypothetical protein
MIAAKTNPVGIDKRIDSLQKAFYSSLIKKWNIPESKYNCYARCYRNQSDGNNWLAEVFDGTDYTEVYFNDNVSVVSFFGIGNESAISQDGVMTGNVHILFFVNLKDIKPGIERNDEEARIDVQKVIETFGEAHGFLITKQIIGIDKILNEYPGTRKSEGLKFRDQHPLHCFRFDTQVFYQPTIC